MIYEYDYENVNLDDKQKHLLDLGIANISDINIKIKEIFNRRCNDGWEPLYPFSVPMLWFKRPVSKKISSGKSSNKKKKS